MTETTSVIEMKKSYGTSCYGTEQPHQHQQQQQQPQPITSSNSSPSLPAVLAAADMLYCVHGKFASTCCDKRPSTERLHCHKRSNDGNGDAKARRKLIVACILCIGFMIVEIIGGVLSNSLAIATDAAHLLTDLTSFLISLFALWIARRPSTKKMSFGWYRAEVIGALTSVLMIWVMTGILVYMAIERCYTGDFEVDAEIMLITSGIAIVFNVIMGWQLHDSPHGHSHGGLGGGSHGHSHGGGAGGNEDNLNVRAAFIHVVGDVLQSVGVFVAALVIYFVPTWRLADPICTFIFAIVVLGTTIAILRDTLLVLMEGTPRSLNYTDIKQLFLNIDGIRRVHNLRVWNLSSNKIALSAHLAIDLTTDSDAVLEAAMFAVNSTYNIFEITLQIERYDAKMEACVQCVEPLV